MLETQNSVKKEPMFHRDTVTCKICQVLNTNKQLFLTHITQKHFAEEIRKKLPQVPPYTCPFKKCHQVKHDKNSLLMHYGIDHDISIGFYNNFKVFFNYELNYLGPCQICQCFSARIGIPGRSVKSAQSGPNFVQKYLDCY